MGLLGKTAKAAKGLLNSGDVFFHGRGNALGDLRPTPHDETGIDGVSFSRDVNIANEYATPEMREYRGEGSSTPNIYPARIDGDIVDYMEFTDRIANDLGEDFEDILDADILKYAKDNNISAIDYSDVMGFDEVSVLDPSRIKSVFESNKAATMGAGILGLGAAAQSNDTYADYSPSNLARLQSSDVGSIEAPQSMAASNIAGLMGSVNKVGYDDPLLGMVASQLPSELMNKIAYNDRRGLLDYAKAYAGLLGF
jgi:hypothetical protein